MLTLKGNVDNVMRIAPSVVKATGEKIPERSLVQVLYKDGNGRSHIADLFVPLEQEDNFQRLVGQEVTVPVRAWAPGVKVTLSWGG